MADPHLTTPSAPSPNHGDLENLVPVPPKKSLLSSVFPRSASVARRYPFLLATFLYAVLVGMTAGVSRWSHSRDTRPVSEQIPDGQSGVRFLFMVSLAPVGFEPSRNNVDRPHRPRIDLASRTLSVKWEIAGCGVYRLPTYPPVGSTYAAAGCDSCNRALDIYLNGLVCSVRASANYLFTTYSAPEPTFSYDPTNFPAMPESYGPLL